MFFKQNGTISSLNIKLLKLVDFIYLSHNILSTESDINICIGMAWTAINTLPTIWKTDLTDKIK